MMKHRARMVMASMRRSAGVGAIGAVVGLGSASCSSAEDAVVGQTEEEIRNGLPSLIPQADAVVLIDNGAARGSGTMIAPDWVLTAGHVVDNPRSLNSIEVRWGNQADTNAQVVRAAAIYLHPNYRLGEISSPDFPSTVDVALIRLEAPVVSALTRVISTASTSSFAGQTVHCNGYGMTQENDPASAGVLTSAFLPVGRISTNWIEVDANQFPLGSQVPLRGDSGGPCYSLTGEIMGVISSNDIVNTVNEAFLAPAASFRAWVDTTMSSCQGNVPSTPSFCDSTCRCTYGATDCDSDSQCHPSFVCDADVGPGFGQRWDYDVCVSAGCASRTLGNDDYCDPVNSATQCPGGYGAGDCDSDNECQVGLVCNDDIGPAFKMKPITDVCVPAACALRDMGADNFCDPNGSTACPCGHGGGDCDNDSECMPGLVCASDLGPAFGARGVTDVCVPAACAGRALYGSEFCSADCPCGDGGGDCDDDSECLPGLVCGADLGPDYGQPSSWDICVRP